MQPLSHQIFFGILLLWLVQKGSVIYLARVAHGTKTNIFVMYIELKGQKFSRNAKNDFEYLKIIWTCLFSQFLEFLLLNLCGYDQAHSELMKEGSKIVDFNFKVFSFSQITSEQG